MNQQLKWKTPDSASCALRAGIIIPINNFAEICTFITTLPGDERAVQLIRKHKYHKNSRIVMFDDPWTVVVFPAAVSFFRTKGRRGPRGGVVAASLGQFLKGLERYRALYIGAEDSRFDRLDRQAEIKPAHPPRKAAIRYPQWPVAPSRYS